jgi:hypothetical protein
MTLIAQACAAHELIEAIDMCLKKQPVLLGTAPLGVRLQLSHVDLQVLRKQITSL